MTLPDYWRHLFVLVLLYVLRHASNMAAEAKKTDDHAFSQRLWNTMALQLLVGVAIATVLSFGMALLVGTQPGLFTQIVFIASFCLALLAYDAVYVYWHADKLIMFYNAKFNKHQSPAEYIDERMRDALNRTVLAFLFGATCFVILELQNFPRAFVPASLASLSTVGLVWIAKAGQITSKMSRGKNWTRQSSEERVASDSLRNHIRNRSSQVGMIPRKRGCVRVAQIARTFSQDKQIEKRVALTILALARLGHLSSTDGGRLSCLDGWLRGGKIRLQSSDKLG